MRFSRRLLFVLGAASTFILTLAGQSVRVLSVSGEATLQSPTDATPRPLKVGDTIIVGTRIVTGAGSRVILTPLPGVKSIIAPLSDLVIERVATSSTPGSTVSLQQATLDLKTGAITTDLQTSEGIALDYQIRTARGVAGARGTTYTVAINTAGIETVVVAEGTIILNLADGRRITLAPGQVSITQPDGATRTVTRAADLSAADQALAGEWIEATIDALAAAVEADIDLQPAALENAADAATAFGIELDAQTRAALENARRLLEQRRQADASNPSTRGNRLKTLQEQLEDHYRPGDGPGDRQTNGGGPGNLRELVTQNRTDTNEFLFEASRARYFTYLTDTRSRGNFDGLPIDRRTAILHYFEALPTNIRQYFADTPFATQNLLVTLPADLAVVRFAIQDDGDGGYHSESVIRYFDGLNTAARARFTSLSFDHQRFLTNYALAQGRTALEIAFASSLNQNDFSIFLGFPSDVQALLVATNQPAFTDYAFATDGQGGVLLHKPADILYVGSLSSPYRNAFFALDPNTQGLLVRNPTDADLKQFILEAVTPGVAQIQGAFYAQLPSNQRLAFRGFPSDIRTLLVATNSTAFNNYAFATNGQGGTLLHTPAEIRYVGALSAPYQTAFFARDANTQALLLAQPTDADLKQFLLETASATEAQRVGPFYSQQSLARRLAFRELTATQRDTLVTITNPGVADYVLAAGRPAASRAYALSLDPARAVTFLDFLTPEAQQVVIDQATDSALQIFVYGQFRHTPAAVVYYASLSGPDRALLDQRPHQFQDLVAVNPVFRDLVFANVQGQFTYPDAQLWHYLDLSTSDQPKYLAQPFSVRDKFAALNKSGLTQAVLDPTNFGPRPPTDAAIERNLDALLALTPTNRILYETLAGGATYARLAFAPRPENWSNPAFTRTSNSFNSLAAARQTQLVALGAAGSIMDHSGTYLEAALAEFSQLPAPARAAITAAGWGRYFTAYLGDDTLRSTFASAGSLTVAEQATLHQFFISPYALTFEQQESGTTALLPRQKLALLAALPVTDRTLLASLGMGEQLLFQAPQTYFNAQTQTYVTETYSDLLARTVTFAGNFTPTERAALRDLNAEHWLFTYRSNELIRVDETTSLTATQFISARLAEYLSPSFGEARRQAVGDLRLFEGKSLNDTRLDPVIVTKAIDAWLGLPPVTRDYLAAEAPGFDLLEIHVNGGGESNYRSLDSISALVTGLTATERGLLRDLDASNAVLTNELLSSIDSKALTRLKDVLGQFGALNDLQHFTLRELGIIGQSEDRRGIFFADPVGLDRLLREYALVDAADRADTRQISPYDSGVSYQGNNFFFSADQGINTTTFDVGFTATRDLRVGATRRLSLHGFPTDTGITFQVPPGKDLYLHASDLIDLNGVTFSNGIRRIAMSSITQNVYNVNFPAASVVTLTSRDGGMGTGNRYPNFDGSSIVGRVNFIGGVSYGGINNVMFNEATFDQHSNGNIIIHSFLTNPVGGPAPAPKNP